MTSAVIFWSCMTSSAVSVSPWAMAYEWSRPENPASLPVASLAHSVPLTLTVLLPPKFEHVLKLRKLVDAV